MTDKNTGQITGAANRPWIRVPPDTLTGKGLEPYPAGDVSSLFDWSENPEAGSAHFMISASDFLLDVVAIEPNAVHQHCKPDDEIVFVASGALHLTSDVNQQTLTVNAGEIVYIPRGWAGLYRCDPVSDGFIEVAIVPHDYFDTSKARENTDFLPRKLNLATRPGQQIIECGGFQITTHVCDAPGRKTIGGGRDLLLLVMNGDARLSCHGEGEHLGKYGMAVFQGNKGSTLDYTAGFFGVELTWHGPAAAAND